MSEQAKMQAQPESTSFAVPNNPSTLPQDIEIIMGMVQGTTEQESSASRDQAAKEDKADSDSDSESSSSSESESDSDVASTSSSSSAASSIRGPPRQPSGPMSAETRDKLMAQLTSFYADDNTLGDENDVGYITQDSDEMDEGLVDMELDMSLLDEATRNQLQKASVDKEMAKITPIANDTANESDESNDQDDSSDDDEPMEPVPMILDESDDDQGGPANPPKTIHEVEDDQAVVPSIEQLPPGERMVLAGEVMSLMLSVSLPDTDAAERTDTKQDQSESPKTEPVVLNPENPAVAGAEPAVSSSEDTAPTSIEAVATQNPSAEPANDDTSAQVSSETVQSVDPNNVASQPSPSPLVKQDPVKSNKSKGKPHQNKALKSAGTIVIRAMRPPKDMESFGNLRIGDDEGWLEEGSLICLEGGKVLAVVSSDPLQVKKLTELMS